MKKVLALAAVWAVYSGLVYLVWSFAELSFNPSDWGLAGRMCVSGASFFILLGLALKLYLDD